MAIPDLTRDPRFHEQTLEQSAADRDQDGVDSAYRLLLAIDPERAERALEAASP